ncbi:hypothetical protein E3224_14665 [Listeria monocytogenes]|nr:hypothetical protein [Listeria monocytogenes]
MTTILIDLLLLIMLLLNITMLWDMFKASIYNFPAQKRKNIPLWKSKKMIFKILLCLLIASLVKILMIYTKY